MATVIYIDLEEKTFENFFRAHCALHFAKEGLTNFVEEVILDFKTNLLNLVMLSKLIPLGTTCSSCTTANVLDCPTTNFCSTGTQGCKVHDLQVPSKMPSKPCPKKLCDGLRNGIMRGHRFNNPSWSNSDARRWCTDLYQLSKCFMPINGYSEIRSFAETDFTGLITIIYTNKWFQIHMSADLSLEPNVCSTALDISCEMGKSADRLLSGKDLILYIDVLKDLLRDQRSLAKNHKAQEAVHKLEQLKFKYLNRNTEDTKEMKEFENDMKKYVDMPLAKQTNKEEKLQDFKQHCTGKTQLEDLPKEPSDWDHFLELIDCDENIATESLIKQSFPSKTQLNKLQQKYLENKSKIISDLLKTIEDRICKCVKTSHKNIQNTWLGYTIDQSGNVNVELIIEMDGSKDDIKLDIEYDHKMIQVHVFSPEARLVMEQSEKVDDLSYREINEMRKCINENFGKLMEHHKHLTIINASPVRSKGFCCMKHKIIPEKCLVFYVRKKGYIPISEEPFESEYDGFPIDVREGAFYTSMIAGSDSELKMGCTIAKKVASFTDQDRYQYGTLGGFIEHPQYGLCGLTCAHVLLDDVEMARLQDLGELTWLDFNSNVDVYLYRDTHIKIGRLVKAILTRGDERSHGIDAAIFQIENLFPTHGLFVNEISEAAHFDSGKVYGPSRFSSELNVFKYGSTTGKTSGVFLNRMPVITVRTQADQFPANIVMYNQIEIKGVNNIEFSQKGDSGSLVMIDDQNGERFCVGVVEGGTSYGSTVVTPVCPVLETLNVTSLKCFESDQIKDTVRRLERSLVQTNDKIEETKNEILTAVRNLRQPDQYRFQCLIL